jgi:hypothetical protein
VEKYCRAGQATDDNLARAHCMCWIPKATNIHSGCVILIALLHLLHVRTAMLRYTFIAYFVLFDILKCFISTFLNLSL